jgi:hypothetical protein
MPIFDPFALGLQLRQIADSGTGTRFDFDFDYQN